MKQRILLTLIMASMLSGMLLDRVMVSAFGVVPIHWAGLGIGVILNACIARAAYVRLRTTRMQKDGSL